MPVQVKHIMTAPVVTLFAEQTLPLVEDIMAHRHLRHLPVIDDEQRLVGLVSHRDLLAAQISNLTGLSDEQRRARQEEVRARDVMTRDVWRVQPDTLASVAGRMLLDHAFGCLPVVSETDRLLGIVTELSTWEGFGGGVDPVYKPVVAFAVLILVLLARPQGLLGRARLV